jgi:hypothetical protein
MMDVESDQSLKKQLKATRMQKSFSRGTFANGHKVHALFTPSKCVRD